MRMTKLANPAKSIMMLLLLIGKLAFFSSNVKIGICLRNLFLVYFLNNRLLDRDQVGDEEATLDDEEEDGFLKAFKVNCHYLSHTCLFSKCLLTLFF